MNVHHALNSKSALLFAALTGILSESARLTPAASPLEIRTLSARPDMVSGGDVLVQVVAPGTATPGTVTITLNGRDVTTAFRPTAPAGPLVGLLTGLSLGRNTIAAKTSGASEPRTLEITNYPITGPVFSGPHQTPFICETETFDLEITGGTLGPQLDQLCSAATKVNYVYRSTAGSFKALPNPAERPADLARTTTSEGRSVNYIVRVETGTINRAIYQTAVLHDPAADPPITPWSRPAGWNGKLIYTFGGGINPGYHQGLYSVGGGRARGGTLGVLNNAWLSLGYASAAATLTVHANSENTVVSAETVMMIREHFIEQAGVPRFTIGTGLSGGSMQVREVAHAYPGIFDGIVPSGFADTITTIHNNTDCALLVRVFAASTVPFSHEAMTAVSGYGDWQGCLEWTNLNANLGRAQAAQTPARATTYPLTMQLLAAAIPDKTLCSPAIPLGLTYDRVKNPKGARCTYQDNNINIFGRDPKTGFARRPLDNVGVQYGLVAFNAGKITAEQFLYLNEHVGGFDPDGNFSADRYAADPEAVRMAYVSGRMTSGRGLATIPMIDEAWHSFPDGFRNGRIAIFSVRARLMAANGQANNQVIVLSPPAVNAVPQPRLQGGASLIKQMDQWPENIARDTSRDDPAAKVARNKPADLVDSCYNADGMKIAEPADATSPKAVCNQLSPVYTTPRMAAGAPMTDDVLKCQLKPVSAREYAHSLTADQATRLKAIFPNGVCDFSKPGVGQQPVQPWLSYAAQANRSSN